MGCNELMNRPWGSRRLDVLKELVGGPIPSGIKGTIQAQAKSWGLTPCMQELHVRLHVELHVGYYEGTFTTMKQTLDIESSACLKFKNVKKNLRA